MSLKLLVRKLSMDDRRFITSSVLREYCLALKLDYYVAIRYLTFHKYLLRILKGVFYKPSIGERKLRKIEISHLDAVAEALRIKGVRHWHFGLETALKLNKATHEHFVMDYVMSDSIFRAKPVMILGYQIRFIKLKKGLFAFGIRKNGLPHSDMEKTLLDIVYLAKYDGLPPSAVRSRIADILPFCSKTKLLMYAKKYNTKVHDFVEGLL